MVRVNFNPSTRSYPVSSASVVEDAVFLTMCSDGLSVKAQVAVGVQA